MAYCAGLMRLVIAFRIKDEGDLCFGRVAYHAHLDDLEPDGRGWYDAHDVARRMQQDQDWLTGREYLRG